jgi:hypothetical protein
MVVQISAHLRRGRRPEGFTETVPIEPGTSLAEFWSACAVMEAASATAFAALACDLAEHEAPTELIARAQQAGREEVEHYRITRALAWRHGATRVPFPRPPIPPLRSLEELALENAHEGVEQTFSAAVALWQARAAGDPAARSAMNRIATDELSHAQLAWDVDTWLRERAGEETSRLLDEARADAAETLLSHTAAATDETLVKEAGLPPPPAARYLATRVNASLWRERAA